MNSKLSSPTCSTLFGLVLLPLLGCARPTSQPLVVSRNEFSIARSCPADRVTVTQADLPPPADFANDAERVAVWRKNQPSHFVVEGCGERSEYDCSNIFRDRRMTEPYWRCAVKGAKSTPEAEATLTKLRALSGGDGGASEDSGTK